jgi:EAL domain-containing protein (putative c-di-GMP-specific phosphodiesterase class I)
VEQFCDALEDGDVVLHYQPQVDLATQSIVAAEALLRWNHPSGVVLSPDDFLPDIAQTPLMPVVTDWVIATACEAAAAWGGGASVAVNIAASDVTRASLVPTVRSAIGAHGLSPDRLTIELTEHALVADLDRATKNLGRLADDGVRISLDDFGTGYSSLLYLKRLPITEIKIDRQFTAGLTDSDDDHAIVSGIVRLARTIGVDLVAEGVETEEQARLLIQLGCHRGQGFLFGRPATDFDPRAKVSVPLTPNVRRRLRRRGGAIATPDVQPVIQQMLAEGASFHTIAANLNRHGHLTAHGSRWVATTVAGAVAQLNDRA